MIDYTNPVHAVESGSRPIPLTLGNVSITVSPLIGSVDIEWTDPLGDDNHLLMGVPEAKTFAGDLIKAINNAEREQLRYMEERWGA